MMDNASTKSLERMGPTTDPWDPLHTLERFGRHVLTSVEFTVANLCNMRCEHCAVGDTLTMVEGDKIPLDFILKALDQVEHLQTISITGGEPSYNERTVKEYIVPLLQYAGSRGIRSQINSNLTLDLSRYEMVAPYLDVMHITYNYAGVEDFCQIGFAKADRRVPYAAASKLYEQMVENARVLSKGGLFVSAESMINYRTHLNIAEIHRRIIDMGCGRHEVHPMYPSSFAAELPMLELRDIREAIHRLLDARDKSVWMLFGTLPFYHCNPNEEDQSVLKRLLNEDNVSVRNDPDGRNRLNVNLFTGDVYVTDFADLPPLGNIHQDRLETVFDRWLEHPLNLTVNCHCPAVNCCGPNLLVKNSYYRDIDFKKRKAIL
jgi:radical SAM/CxCxxxxC motif protein YfkAB